MKFKNNFFLSSFDVCFCSCAIFRVWLFMTFLLVLLVVQSSKRFKCFFFFVFFAGFFSRYVEHSICYSFLLLFIFWQMSFFWCGLPSHWEIYCVVREFMEFFRCLNSDFDLIFNIRNKINPFSLTRVKLYKLPKIYLIFLANILSFSLKLRFNSLTIDS
jgi:hypothetical protein